MDNSLVSCPMCGYRFDPGDHAACQACPLQKGCQLACCPACGFEVVNVENSKLARIATRLFSLRRAETAPGQNLDPKE